MTRLPRPGVLVADLGACLRFFSRLPVPALSTDDDPAAMPRFGRAAAMTPLAGLGIALPAAAVGLALSGTDLPGLVVGAAVVAALALATGALHEDGLADTADGLWGGSGRERRLEIMRDSRIGSYGALALALTILVRAAAYAAIADRAAGAGGLVLAGAVLAAAAASRAVMVRVWNRLPPARPDGLSAAAGQPSAAAAGVALAIGFAAALLALPVAGPSGVAAALVLAALAAAGIAALARAKIGGQTGDVLGATQQLGELGFLLGLLI